MFNIMNMRNWLYLSGTLAIALLSYSTICSEVAAQNAGPVVGHIDGIRFESGAYHISGWACRPGSSGALGLHLYADSSPLGSSKRSFILAGQANLSNEAAVSRTCQDSSGGGHRFQIELPGSALSAFGGRKLYLLGVVAGREGSAITGSGIMQLPGAPQFRSIPNPLPPLSGKYRGTAQHPRVFTTPDDLKDLVTRINSPRSFSAQSFARLAKRVAGDLAARVDWDAVYSGCDIDIYLRAFSIESRGGYAGEVRGEDALAKAMGVRSGTSPQAGGAVVASRLALYAALVKSGAVPAGSAPNPDEAVALAKRILLAWARRGFRDEKGNLRKAETEFCDGDGRQVPAQTLQVARGIVYSVHAHDLLQGLHALNEEEEAALNSFHGNMYDWIRNSSNEEYSRSMRWKYSDETYNNQFANHLLALLALSRLFDDQQRFAAVLYGANPSIPVSLPWLKLFNYVIYGVGDTPLLNITPNSNEDPSKSSPAYSTKVVAAGEINDRYRNLTPLQGMGYPVFTLEHLLGTAEIMRIAGFDAYGYRGSHKQSIEMAAQYYACYAQYVGFKKTVTADNAKDCPDFQQYIGKVVNDVENVIVVGAYRFPGNAPLTALDLTAKAEISREDAPDTIRFGRWKD